ncbi:MAG: lysylphosphatidylglycerol synthase transmembrane domain-containing protein [Actinomycetota bacterium]
MKKLPSWVKPLLRILVGAAVFAVVVFSQDLHKLGHELAHASKAGVIIAAAMYFLALFVSAFRWREYLEALEFHFPYATLFRLYFVGTFFNAFLPSGVGGDAYKALRIGKARGATPRAFSSVFLDRFAGIVGLAVIGLVLSLVRLFGGDHSWVPAIAALCCVGILGAALLLVGPGEKLLGKGRFIKREGWGGKLREMVRGIHEAGRHPRAAWAGIMLGVLFQGMFVVYHIVLANALGIHLPFTVYSCIIVLISVAILIPLAPGGLGMVEFVYVQSLLHYGVTKPVATAFALLLRAVMMLASASGGIVYLVFGGDVAPVAPTPDPVRIKS